MVSEKRPACNVMSLHVTCFIVQASTYSVVEAGVAASVRSF